MTKKWLCKIDEEEVGPLESAQIKTLVVNGTLKAEHHIREENGKWQTISSVPQLKKLLASIENSRDEIAPPLSQTTLKMEDRPKSEAVMIANSEDSSRKADGELRQLLFSGRRQLLTRRLAAWTIDAFVLSVVANITFMIVFVTFFFFAYFMEVLENDPIDHGGMSFEWVTPAAWFGFLVAVLVAGRVLFQRDAGYSGLGKCFLGIMAVDHAGRPCTPDRSFRRNFVLLLPMMPIVEGVIALRRKDSRRLGDLMAGTFVVREYLPFLEQVISTGQQDTVWKAARWILQTELCIPDKNLKKRDSNLLRMFLHTIKRQKRVCDRLIQLDMPLVAKAEVLRELRSVADLQLNTFREMNRSRLKAFFKMNRKMRTSDGLQAEHVLEFHSLQQQKLELVDKL